MAGRTDDVERDAYSESIFPEHYGWSGLASLRTKDLHYIEAPRPELYDLVADPSEAINVAPERAAKVTELQSELDALRERYGAPEQDPRAGRTVDPETREKLAALGYLSVDLPSSGDRSKHRPDPKDKIELFKLIRSASTDSDEGRHDEAVSKLERVIEQDPDIPEAYNILGNVYQASGEREPSVAAYRRALALEPDYKPALFSLALSFQEAGHLDEASAGFERLIELDPHSNQASLLLAEIEIERKRFERAQSILDRVEPTNNPERALVHHLKARRHVALGELAPAQSELEKAIELDPKLKDAHYDLGLVLEDKGDAEGARRAYEKEIEVAPENFLAHFNLAKLLSADGKAPEMIDHLEKAIAVNPDFAVGHLYLANAYLEQGNLERAIKLARRGIALGPEPSLVPFGHFILADVYHRLGRAEDAAREMALARKLRGS